MPSKKPIPIQGYQCSYSSCNRVLFLQKDESPEGLLERANEHTSYSFTPPLPRGFVFFEPKTPHLEKHYCVLTGKNKLYVPGYAKFTHSYNQEIVIFNLPLNQERVFQGHLRNSRELEKKISDRSVKILSLEELSQLSKFLKSFRNPHYPFYDIDRSKPIRLLRTNSRINKLIS
ncbi:hypothetical protein GOV12_02075 [Candidatus Pacearchaeota archaeon]|nr:hypothetical protein [Candidatus Pacearchaeota archaeon]